MNSAWDPVAECKCQAWWVWNTIQTHYVLAEKLEEEEEEEEEAQYAV